MTTSQRSIHMFVSTPPPHRAVSSSSALSSSCSSMFFPRIKYHRSRPGAVRLPLCTPLTVQQKQQRRRQLICTTEQPSTPPSSPLPGETQSQPQSPPIQSSPTTVSESHQSAQQVDPQRAKQFEDRLLISRTRSRQLYSILLSRFVQTANDKATTILSSPPMKSSPPSAGAVDTTAIANAARRLRKRMRAARSAADDALQPDDMVWTSLARLQSLVEELELRVDTEIAYGRDRLQEELEYSVAVRDDATDGDMRSFREDDAQSGQDSNLPKQLQNIDRERLTSGLRKTVSGIEGRVSEFVRKDGSIDVDGLRGWARRLLDSISVIWMRLNGRTPSDEKEEREGDNSTTSQLESRAVVSIADLLNFGDIEREFRLREEIGQLEKKLNDSSKDRESALRREDQLGKLIRARELRQMDDDVNTLRRTLAVRVLQLELERVLVAVVDEIERADFDTVLDQRVLAIEFGDLDERLSTLDVFVSLGESILIEDDLLGELAADMQDMKTRLGLDSALYSSSTLSMDQVRQFFTSSSKKARTGFDFYSRGMRLFFGDLRFAWSLISRTVGSGYTPSGREVRTLRRTGRDLLTLVPFTIVLIAPLTPVGHVLIFSFLQRYWPEFFPSTFSERRQSMMRKREIYLAKLQREGKSEDDDDKDDTHDDDDDLGLNVSGSSPFQPGNPFGRSSSPSSNPTTSETSTRNNGYWARGGSSRRSLDRNGASGNTEGAGRNSSVDLSIENLTGKSQAGDVAEQARKERQRIALDELHLAD